MASAHYNASLIIDETLGRGQGDNVAIRAGHDRLTYAQLSSRVASAGNALRAIGVTRERRVLLVLDDTPTFPAAFLGAMRIGAVPVPVSPLDKVTNFRHYASDSGAEVAIVDHALVATLSDAWDGLDIRIFAADGPAEQVDSFAEIAGGQPAELSPHNTHRDDVAFWLYSSGSTGLPKGVVHLHGDIACTCRTYGREVLQITERDVVYSTTKLFHAYGLGNSLSFPYSVGATVVLRPGRSNASDALATVAEERPTILCSVPALYRAMLAEPAADLRSVRMCVSAAEPLPSSTQERWIERYGIPICDGIGSTEMLHIYCSNRSSDYRAGTSGRPVPGYELRLVDPAGRDVNDGTPGQLLVRGESCAAYYWRQRQKSKQAMQGEWFASGDRYRVDEDGYYTYEGRVDDMLKVGGLWVSPADMEDVLMKHPAVSEAAVIGLNVDDVSRIKAFVIRAKAPGQDGASSEDELAEQLRGWCKQHLRRYEVPHYVAFVEDFPRTLTGKVQRYRLRELS